MDSVCYKLLEEVRKELEERNLVSYSDYDELKRQGILDRIINNKHILGCLETEVRKFFNILDSEYYKDKPAYRKQLMYQNSYVAIVNNNIFNYLLCLYFNIEETYRIFPLFTLEIAKKFNIDKYKDMTFQEMFKLLNDNMDLTRKYDYKYKKELIELVPRYPSDVYQKYDIMQSTINFDNIEEYFVMTEYDAFLEECKRAEDEDEGAIVNHTARNLGDGFGYDVYSYDSNSNREKLIEVKSGRYTTFYLTLNEFKVLQKTKDQQKTDYYIYKSFYNMATNLPEVYILKYDKDEDIFIDQYNDRYEISAELNYDSRHKIIPLIMFEVKKIIDYSKVKEKFMK